MNQRGYDKALIGQYLARSEKSCISHVVRRIHNIDIAEEICQDACLETLEYIMQRGIFEETDIRKIMFKIAERKICNYFSKASTQREILTDVRELEAGQADDSDKYDWMMEVLQQKIQLLKPVEQKIILGRLEGKSNEELATQLGRSVHAVDCVYSRTVRKLKKLIHEKASEMERLD